MDAQIANYMTAQPHSIRSGETLRHARDMMEKYSIRHLPVLNGGRLVGTISDRDFSLVSLFPDLSLENSRVEEIMCVDVYSVNPKAPLHEVVEEMGRRKVGSVVIVDDSEHLLGIFTAIDALRLLGKIYNTHN